MQLQVCRAIPLIMKPVDRRRLSDVVGLAQAATSAKSEWCQFATNLSIRPFCD